MSKASTLARPHRRAPGPDLSDRRRLRRAARCALDRGMRVVSPVDRRSPRRTRSSSVSRRRSPPPRTRSRAGPVGRRDDLRARAQGPADRAPVDDVPGTTTGPFAEVVERSGLKAGVDFDLAFAPERVNPGDPPAPRRRPTPRRGDHAAGHEAGRRAAAQHQRPGRRAVVAGRGRAGEAPRERLPQHQHRVREPARTAVRADGPRRLGGHQRRGDEAVRVHEVHARSGRRRALHPGRSLLPVVARPRVRLHRPLHRGGRRHQLRDAAPRRRPRRRGAQRPRARAQGREGGVLGVAFKPNVQDARNSPAADVLAGIAERGADVRYHDPHVPSFRDSIGAVRGHAARRAPGLGRRDRRRDRPPRDRLAARLRAGRPRRRHRRQLGRAPTRPRQVLRLGAGWSARP